MAIKAPSEMDFSNKNIIMIISALPGVGKTTLALSAPDVLLIDTDNGMCRVRNEHKRDASICSTYEEVLEDIKAAEGKYKTIVVDTCGELITMLKDWAMRTDPKASKANGGFSLQGYGVIKDEFLRLSADLRKRFNVVFVFHEQISKNNEDIFYELVCEGASRTLAYQPADLAAHMFIQNGKRMLGFTPTDNYSAKGAYGIKGVIEVPELKQGDPNDFLTKLFDRVRKYLSHEFSDLTPKFYKYNLAMEAGLSMLNAVTEPDHVTWYLDAIKELEHDLTSEAELKSALKKRMSDLGIVYDKKNNAYKWKAGAEK